MRRAIAGLAALVLVSAACAGGSEAEDAGSEADRRITLVTHDSFDASEDVLAAFEREHGITVDIVAAGDAGQALNRAILTAGSPEGDVLFGIDDHLLEAALGSDVFVPYTSPRLGAVDDAFEIDPTHRLVPIDHGEVCVNTHPADLAQRGVAVPTSFEDLVDPAYRDMLVVENPATSTPGLAFLLATIAEFGDPGWEEYWTGLVDNGVSVVDGWEQAYYGGFSGAGGGEGDRPLVVSYATSPVAEVVFAEEPLTEAPTGVMTDTCLRQIEFAGILRGTEHEAEARALIDFLLSRPFQEDIPLRMFVYPVAGDAELPAAFVEHAVQVDEPLSVPPEVIEEHRSDWVDRWTDLVLR